MKKNWIYILLGTLISIYSCGRTTPITSHCDITYINDTLQLNKSGSSYNNILINCLDATIYDTIITSPSWSSSLLELLKKQSIEDQYEYALYATQHNNTIPFNIHIGDIDTTYTIQLIPFFNFEQTSTIKGKCAPLISKYENPSHLIETKKWLFRQKEHLTNAEINNMIGILNELSRMDTNILITTAEIPIIKTLTDKKYTVTSNIKADYYVLYACSYAEEIDNFVEYVVANDFGDCSLSLNSPLKCYSEEDPNGYKCITLIAINNDWTYETYPLGWVAIDNSKPQLTPFYKRRISSIAIGNNKVILPLNAPLIDGHAMVNVDNWDGNGVSCNCTFSITFAGDVKSVVIHRKNNLATWLSYSNKTINLSEVKSPYIFTYELHFDDGDNFIPFTIYDYHGNKTESEIKVRAAFEYVGSSDINIDNNIDIY